MVPLGEVALVNPRADATAHDSSVSFVGMAELDAEQGVARPLATRSFADVSKGYTVFRNHDVLAAKITPCWENGKVGQAALDHPVGVGSTEFHVLRPGADLNDRYLLQFLRQPWIRSTGEARMTGSAGQKRVPASFFRDLEIPLPPLPEQRRIAAILDHADALRAKRRQVLAHLDGLTQSIFHDMFSADRYPSRPLEQVADPDDRINYGVVQPGDETPDGVPLIRVSDMVRGRIDRTNLKRISPTIEASYQRSRIRGNEILVSSVGSIGAVSVVGPADVGSNIARAITRVPVSDEVLRTYVAAYLRTPTPQHYFIAELRTVAQPTLNVGQLAATLIPLPPVTLQAEFRRRLQRVEELTHTVRTCILADDELFASLQARAFDGRL